MYELNPEGAVENEEVKSVVGHCSVWQHDRGKKENQHHCNLQERAQGNIHWYCCSSWFKSRGKRKGENGKVSGLKEKDWNIVATENGRGSWLVVIGALGSVTKEFDGWTEKPGITNNAGVIQKTALLGNVRILLEM